MVGILDWGLGHAARTIPLIRYLLQFQCQVLVAAGGRQKKLLQQEFPGLQFLSPPDYNVRYNASAGTLVFGLIGQVPRLLRVIQDEHLWVSRICKEYNVNAIISDNRYGFYAKEVPSVFITHQVAPISGLGKLFDHILKYVHLKKLRHFTECWVPDSPGNELSGQLSSPGASRPGFRFIGPLSRFDDSPAPSPGSGKLLVLLSGPEPSRTRFEEKLLVQLARYQGPYTIVRGLPGGGTGDIPNGVDHLDAAGLSAAIADADLILCRSGYTTIMDLVAMKKTALLVPTPGQTEQEYLAEYLSGKGYFITVAEKDLDLQKDLPRLRNFAPVFTNPGLSGYKTAVEDLLKKINQNH